VSHESCSDLLFSYSTLLRETVLPKLIKLCDAPDVNTEGDCFEDVTVNNCIYLYELHFVIIFVIFPCVKESESLCIQVLEIAGKSLSKIFKVTALAFINKTYNAKSGPKLASILLIVVLCLCQASRWSEIMKSVVISHMSSDTVDKVKSKSDKLMVFMFDIQVMIDDTEIMLAEQENPILNEILQRQDDHNKGGDISEPIRSTTITAPTANVGLIYTVVMYSLILLCGSIGYLSEITFHEVFRSRLGTYYKDSRSEYYDRLWRRIQFCYKLRKAVEECEVNTEILPQLLEEEDILVRITGAFLKRCSEGL